MLVSTAIGIGLVVVSLFAGMAGYHGYEGLSWLDAFLNASMILSGMGPVTNPVTTGGKIFAGLYALYSGFAVLAIASIMLAPAVHRFLHRFHIEGGP
jgi:hypothetical protein